KQRDEQMSGFMNGDRRSQRQGRDHQDCKCNRLGGYYGERRSRRAIQPGQGNQRQYDRAAQEEVITGTDATLPPRSQGTQQVQERRRGRRILRKLPGVVCKFHVGECEPLCSAIRNSKFISAFLVQVGWAMPFGYLRGY